MSLVMLCRYCGCVNYRNPDAEYPNFCDKHQDWARVRAIEKEEKKKEMFSNAHSRTDFHKSYKWKKFAKEYLRQHPICELCGDSATDIHHIVPVADDEELAYDEENLIPLCKSCHYKQTMREINDRKRKK